MLYKYQDMEETKMGTVRGMIKGDVLYIYLHKAVLGIQMNNIMPFPATWMTLEMVILSEGRQKMRRILGLQTECKN